jgi:hypothetical protein
MHLSLCLNKRGDRRGIANRTISKFVHDILGVLFFISLVYFLDPYIVYEYKFSTKNLQLYEMAIGSSFISLAFFSNSTYFVIILPNFIDII